MNYFKNILKKAGWISIVESIIFAILGVILVYKPVGTIKIITWILGSVFIIAGVYKIITYFVSKDKNDFFNYDLTYGLTSIVIGIVAMAYMNIIGTIFRIIIGIWIIYTSFVRINISIQIKRSGSRAWIYSLVLAIFMFICGLYTIINSGVIVATIGMIMLIYSIIDIIENIIFIRNIN